MSLEERRHSERWFRALIDYSTDAIALLARDGTVTYANSSTERVTGYTAEEFMGMNFHQLVHPEDLIHETWSELLDHPGEIVSFEFRLRHKNGTWRWMEGTVTNQLGDATISALVSNYRDITKRRLKEEWLQQSEERYRVLVEQASDGIFLSDLKGHYVDVNATACLLSGYTREELLTKDVEDLTIEEDREALLIAIEALLAGKTIRNQWRMKRKDGSLFRTELTAKRLSNGYLLAIVRDISERILVEKERARLLAREQVARQEAAQHARHLTAVFNAITDGVMVCDARGYILQSNSAFRSLFGIGEDDETALTLIEERRKGMIPRDLEGNLLPKEQWPLMRALRGECLSGTNTVDVLHPIPGGQPLFLNVGAAPMSDAAGTIVGAVLVLRDVTERRQLEQRLQLSERKYRSLVDSNIVGVIVSDPDGKIYEANDRLAEMFGYSKEELLSGDVLWHQFLPPGYNAEHDPVVQSVDATGVFHLLEREHVRKDGSRFPTLMAGAGFDREQRRAVTVFLDITDRKEAEQRKQEFLGMVSHELRTPLTAILGFLELAQLYLQQFPRGHSSEADTILDRIEMVLGRADQQVSIENRLVEALLDVSRMEMHKFELSLKAYNLVTLVGEVVAYQQQVARQRRIELLLPAREQVSVLVDEDRIGQVLINYLTNALKYSPAESVISVGLTAEGTTARVFVRDQGPGLMPSQQQRVWERFYQAESSVRWGSEGGLGLGLYIAKIIVQQHGGQVGVESEPGQGSTFWFALPVIEN